MARLAHDARTSGRSASLGRPAGTNWIRKSKRHPEAGRLVLLGLGVSVAAIAMEAHAIHVFRQMVGPGGTLRCASMLRQLGQAALLFEMDNKRAATTLDELCDVIYTGTETPSDALVCPWDKSGGRFRTPAGRATSFALQADALPSNAPGDPNTRQVIVEDPLVHGSRGSNVLYADGHVSWVPSSSPRP